MKSIYTGLAVAAFLLLFLYAGSKYMKSCNSDDVVEYIYEDNQREIDSLVGIITLSEAKAKALEHRIDSLKNRKPVIAEKYKPIYYEVLNSTDSEQLLITDRLLSAHRENPLKGNQLLFD